MKLHDALYITFPERKENNSFVFYNSLILENLIPEIRSLNSWFSCVAFGSGTDETTSSTRSLSNFLVAKDAALTNFNFDPSLGLIYAEKQVSFGRTDYEDLVFSEVGVAKSIESASTSVLSRFLIKNAGGVVTPITKLAGEVMEVKVVIYLEVSSSNALFCSGDNLLLRAILGLANLTASEKKFYIEISDDPSPNNQYVSHMELVGKESTNEMTVSFSLSSTLFDLDYSFNSASGIEVVVFLNDNPVARYFKATLVENNLESSTASSLSSYYLSNPYVSEVLQIEDKTDPNIYYDYTASSFTLDPGELVTSPFGTTIYDSTFNLVESDDGKSFLFYSTGGVFDYYRIERGYIKKYNSSQMVFRDNIENIIILHNYILVHYKENASSHVDLYLFDGTSINPSVINYAGELSGGFPLMAQFNAVLTMSGTILFGYLTEIPGVGRIVGSNVNTDGSITLGTTVRVSSETAMRHMFAVDVSEDAESYFYCYCTDSSNKNLFVRGDGTGFTAKLTDSATLNMVRYPGWKEAGRFVALHPNRTDRYWLYTKRQTNQPGVNYAYNKAAREIFISRCGKYICDVDSVNSRIYISYCEEHNKQIWFNSYVSYSNLTITDVIPFDEGILLKISESPYYAFIRLTNKYTKIYVSGTGNHTIETIYNYYAPASITDVTVSVNIV